MKSKILALSTLLFFIPLLCSADPVCRPEDGNYPNLTDIINRADAIVVLRVERTLSDLNQMDSFYSTHECFIYQTLKGDIPKNSWIILQLYNIEGSNATPYAHWSNHLIFLVKKTSENEPTDYRMLTLCGAQTLLPPLGLDKKPGGETIEDQVKSLVKDAMAYQTREYEKRMKFLGSMLDEPDDPKQSPEDYAPRTKPGSDEVEADKTKR